MEKRNKGKTLIRDNMKNRNFKGKITFEALPLYTWRVLVFFGCAQRLFVFWFGRTKTYEKMHRRRSNRRRNATPKDENNAICLPG